MHILKAIKIRLGSVLLFCLVLRIIFFWIMQPWRIAVEKEIILKGDANGYHKLAKTIINHHRFAYDVKSESEVLRTPGYPLFVSLIYVLFGIRPWVVLLFQILFDTSICFIFFSIIQRLLDTKIALISSLLYSLDPLFTLYSCMLISDIFFVFFIVLGFYFFIRGIINKGSKSSLIFFGFTGFFLGFATLIRPISLYLPFLYVVFLLIHYRYKIKPTVQYAITILFFFILTLIPWIYRNYTNFNNFSISTSFSYNLLILVVTPIEMKYRNEKAPVVQKELLNEADNMIISCGKNPKELTPFQRANYWHRLALKYITKKPFEFIQLYLKGIIRTFFNINTEGYSHLHGLSRYDLDNRMHSSFSDMFHEFSLKKCFISIFIVLPALLYFFYLLITYLLFIVGFFTILSQRSELPKSLLFFALCIAAYFIIISGAAGLVRFKLPSIPFYLIFSGIGANKILNRKVIMKK